MKLISALWCCYFSFCCICVTSWFEYHKNAWWWI